MMNEFQNASPESVKSVKDDLGLDIGDLDDARDSSSGLLQINSWLKENFPNFLQFSPFKLSTINITSDNNTKLPYQFW